MAEATNLQALTKTNTASAANPKTGHPERTLSDNRPMAVAQRQLSSIASQSRQATALGIHQTMVDNAVHQRKDKLGHLQVPSTRRPPLSVDANAAPNRTGMPDSLKTGIEQLSGMSMDRVRVHYGSDKPAQLNALAYAQGDDIHLGPGQEQHLPHEAWHVVQQQQGRVRATRQLMGKFDINDDAGLEQEADVMGARAVQLKNSVHFQQSHHATSRYGSAAVAQLISKLKIGISGSPNAYGYTADQLPNNTFVWILSNAKAPEDALDKKKNPGKLLTVTSGHNKSTRKEIIDANREVVQVPLYTLVDPQLAPTKGIFQSGIFKVLRTGGSEAAEIDYSFLRFAAMESYKAWHSKQGARHGWPDISADTTLVETIDSDLPGITSDTGDSLKPNNKASAAWLAEAGFYRWDCQEIVDDPRIAMQFDISGTVDVSKRDSRMEAFSALYTKAEKEKRVEASGSIFRIYFPEPATRLSSNAIELLGSSNLGGAKFTRGQQLGYGRESIGMIAALVHLDSKRPHGSIDRSKAKLKFNPAYVISTDLGKRRDAYLSLFLSWNRKIDDGASETDQQILLDLREIAAFDQSYLNPALPGQVEKWHNKSLEDMQSNAENVEKTFFHPKSS